MSRRRGNRQRRTGEITRVFSAVVESIGLGMVIASLLATLSFVAVQAYDQWVRK